MPKNAKAKQKKDTRVAENDTPSFDISKLSDKDRAKILAQLKKDENKREKEAKKMRQDQQKAAEDEAERAYQASKQAKAQPVPRGTGQKKPPPTAPEAGQDSGDEPQSAAEEKNSEDEYESGKEVEIPIDPVLLAQSRARDSSGDEAEQPAKKKVKAASGHAIKTAPTPASANKTKGLVTVNVGAPQALQGSAPSKKKQPALVVSSDSSSSSNDSSDISESEARERAPIGPHTPYKAPAVPRGKNAPILRELTPTTKSIAEDARTKYSVFLVTVDAFPTEKDARKAARKLFIAEVDSAAQDDDDDEEDEDAARRGRRGERAKADKTYREHVNNLVIGVDSSFRGHIVDDAVPLVENEYGLLNGDLDEKAIADKVGRLLEDGSFTFKDWEERDGGFQCPIVPKLLRKAFLTKQVKKGHALGLGPNFQTFSEVSPPLLAFLLTAIECVLMRWQTGKYEKSHFTMTKYEPIYTKHLKALHQTEVTEPGSLAEIRKGIWDIACKTAGIAAPTKVRELDHSGGYMRPDDIAKLRRQQPGA